MVLLSFFSFGEGGIAFPPPAYKYKSRCRKIMDGPRTGIQSLEPIMLVPPPLTNIIQFFTSTLQFKVLHQDEDYVILSSSLPESPELKIHFTAGTPPDGRMYEGPQMRMKVECLEEIVERVKRGAPDWIHPSFKEGIMEREWGVREWGVRDKASDLCIVFYQPIHKES